MSGTSDKNWRLYAMVIGLSAAVGFGAVYAMVGAGNKPESEQEQIESRPKNAEGQGGLANEAVARASQPITASEPAGKSPSLILTGGDGKPLNRGTMTTFVFKKQPMVVEKSPQFNGPDGQPMTLADRRGKVILLNLWATWCAPCRKEMPHLDQLQRELGSDQFEVVALSVDRGGPEKARQFLDEIGIKSLKFYHDPTAKAGFAFMAIGMPTTLLIDREGREIGRLVGPAEWHSDDAKALITAAIAAS